MSENFTSSYPASFLDVDNEAIFIWAVGEVEDTFLVKCQRPLVVSQTLERTQSLSLDKSKEQKFGGRSIFELTDYHLQVDSVGRFGERPVGDRDSDAHLSSSLIVDEADLF